MINVMRVIFPGILVIYFVIMDSLEIVQFHLSLEMSDCEDKSFSSMHFFFLRYSR